MAAKLCSINVDLDEIPNYWAIHGLGADAANATYSVLGRPSRSIVDTPAVLTAPTRPYRVGRPYWKRGTGLLELPVQVTRTLRLPYIGTFLMLRGVTGARFLTKGVLGEP